MKRRAAFGILILVLVFDVLAVVLVYATALRAPVHLAPAATVALFQVPPVVDGMPQIVAASDRVTYVGLLSTFLLMAYSLFKDHRNRKWDLEDRAAARADLKQNQVEAAVLLARGVKNSKEEVLQKIEENTSMTNNLQSALIGKKGCTVGSTLEDIQKALEETKTAVTKTKLTVEKAALISTDTNIKVTAAADAQAAVDPAAGDDIPKEAE